MKINFMPKTRLGKWSGGLIVAFFLLLVIGNFVAALQGPIEWTFFSNPLRSIPMLGATVAGVVAFFAGIVSIWRHKERSILVFVATAIGLFVLLFMLGEIGEILTPH